MPITRQLIVRAIVPGTIKVRRPSTCCQATLKENRTSIKEKAQMVEARFTEMIAQVMSNA